MICYICNDEITRDMTDINGYVLAVPIKTRYGYSDVYICEECVKSLYEDWDRLHEIEMGE